VIGHGEKDCKEASTLDSERMVHFGGKEVSRIERDWEWEEGLVKLEGGNPKTMVKGHMIQGKTFQKKRRTDYLKQER